MRPTASRDFNAYHKWLGILPSEQPPHHYRLLGIALFESDPEVIAAAADRQMAHIKSFAAGRYAAESQTLLNELARARVSLLNDRQKQVYDRGLRQLLAGSALPPPHAEIDRQQPSPGNSATVQAVIERSRENLDSRFPVIVRRNRRRRNGPLGPIFGIALGIVAVGACLYYAAITKPGRPVAGNSIETPSVVESPPTPANSIDRGTRHLQQSRSSAKAIERPQQAQNEANPEINAPPKLRTSPETQLASTTSAPKPPPKVAHVIDLDFESRRQRYALRDDPSRKFRVGSIRGFNYPYLMKPKNGFLDKTNDVAITLNGARDVVMVVSLVVMPGGNASITLESHAITESGEEIPFTLPNLDRVCRSITKQGQDAALVISDMESERSRLQAWINAPVLKPLAERGRARARVTGLGIEITEQSQEVQALRGDLKVAESLRSLAEQLHNECAIEIEEWHEDGEPSSNDLRPGETR
jgi:hypothetical protein